MRGCKGGLHLLYVVGLCGSFKLRVSFQDCLGIPGTKRESGKYMEICYAQGDWHNAQEAKAHQARIHNPGRTAWLHKLQHNTSLLAPYFGLTSLCYMIIVCSLYSTLCPAHVPLNRTSEAVLGYSHIFAYRMLWAHCSTYSTLHCIPSQKSTYCKITAHGIHHGTTHHTE